MIEILSPAGEMRSFNAALENGADAIYMGVSQFNARTMATNFSIEEYIQCIEQAHIRGVRVYLTLNTLLYDDEIEAAVTLLIRLYASGLDAVIIQDIGLFHVIKQVLPSLEVHASTQMSVHNLEQVLYFEKLGFDRIVLARELTVEEIAYIAKNSKIALEVFIHGALCVSYSGQCLMSSMIGKRSGNRGSCAGPCRMKYSLYQDNKPLIQHKYLLSRKDILGVEYVQKLEKLGVVSLKIEGRSKQPEYVALVTQKYRNIRDNISTHQDKKELLQMFNRSGESTGYLKAVESINTTTLDSAKNTGLPLGKVIAVNKKLVQVTLQEQLMLHDGIEIYGRENVVSSIVTFLKDSKKGILNQPMQAGTTVWIGDINQKVLVGDIVYKTSSHALNKQYLASIQQITRKTKVKVDISIQSGEDISLHYYVLQQTTPKEGEVAISYVPEIAKTKGIDLAYCKTAFDKTQDSVFELDIADSSIEDHLYVPMAKLNQLRRSLQVKLSRLWKVEKDQAPYLDKLQSVLAKHQQRINMTQKKNTLAKQFLYLYHYDEKKEQQYLTHPSTAIMIPITDYIIYQKKGADILEPFIGKKEIYMSIANITLDKIVPEIKEALEGIVKKKVAGFLLGNVGFLRQLVGYKQDQPFTIIADYSFNTMNCFAVFFLQDRGIDAVTVLPEMDQDKIEEIAKIIPIQIVKDYVTVMTMRFCPVKAYSKQCQCTNNSYYLKDSFDKQYPLVSSPFDCITKIITEIDNKETAYSSRNCMLS